MKRFALVMSVIGLMAISGQTMAEEKMATATEPILTWGIIGTLVQNAALALGPVRGTETVFNPYQKAAQRKEVQEVSQPSESSKKEVKIVLHQKPAEDNPTAVPQVYRFTGKQMWGEAETTIIPNDSGFIVKVKSTVPVSMYTLYTDDTVIASSKIGGQTVFTFTMRETYNPPYTLTLNVTYMGMPNQIKVEMK